MRKKNAKALLFFLVFAFLLCGVSFAAVSNDDCMGCHSDKSLTKSKAGKTVSLFVNPDVLKKSVHGKKQCVGCHEIKEVPHASKLKAVNCEGCHQEAYKQFKGSIHDQAKNDKRRPSCKGCHGQHDIQAKKNFPNFVCKSCHEKSYDEYKDSAHGLVAKEDKEVATCHDCHGGHAVYKKDNPKSMVYHLNLPRTCSKCHANPELAKRHKIQGGKEYQLYIDSIHGLAISKSGLLVSANCADCHGGHDIKKSKEKDSKINRANIAKNCGRCHAGIMPVYEKSIHGRELAKGNAAAPTCIDCHPPHQIARVDGSGWCLDVIRECGVCHSKFYKTYKDTYHGKVTSLGYSRVAKCADCHGSHNILPAKEEGSMISQKNIVATCEKCHPGSSINFTKYISHADYHNKEKDPVLYYIYKFMTTLLISVFAFFGLHALLWLPRSWIERFSKKGHNESEGGPKW